MSTLCAFVMFNIIFENNWASSNETWIQLSKDNEKVINISGTLNFEISE